jgi:large subunit ribosomal protein L24
MNKIRKGDEVIVITGKDKGKRGMVTSVKIEDGIVKKILVQGVALVVKHVRPNPNAGVEGGLVTKESYINVSNVAIVDSNGKPSRVQIKQQDGKKVRVLKTTGAVIA